MEYIYFEDVRNLCLKKTDLDEQEIVYLEQIMESLLQDTTNDDRDVFIDVRDQASGEGLVVFHRYPLSCESNYENTVVGELAFRKDEPGALRSLDTGSHSTGLLAQTQEGKIIKQDIMPIRSNGRIIGVIIAEKDIGSEILDNFDMLHSDFYMKKFQDVISQVNTIDDSISNYISEAIFIFEKDGKLKYHNRMAKEKYKEFGYLNRLDNLHYNNITMDSLSLDQVQSRLEKTKKSMLDKLVSINKLTYSQKTIYLEDKEIYLLTLSEVESKVPVSGNESMIDTVEIQEIHHRVKNSLQSVISILRLQSRRVKSVEAQSALKESVNRVMAIAATHELLSKQSRSTIQLSLVLERVINQLKRAYGSEQRVAIEVDLDDSIVLMSDTAVTLALITNEIIQNSFEHAFVDDFEDAHPKITVVLARKQSSIYLTIADNGKGFDHEKVEFDSLGLKIIKSFTEDKLNGICEFRSNPGEGTSIHIIFEQVMRT